jgi:hypothetical protein
MVEMTRRVSPLIAASYDFSRFRSAMDVGGGHGALLTAILAKHPALRGIVFDQPHCREGAKALFDQAGLGGRFEFVAGSFFERVPPGADAYLIKSVIHDWDDERSLAILRNVRAAMAADAHLVVVEPIFPDRVSANPNDAMSVFSDLNMLVLAGGLERTERQYRELVEAAGFRVERIVPTPSAFSLIDAVPA